MTIHVGAWIMWRYGEEYGWNIDAVQAIEEPAIFLSGGHVQIHRKLVQEVRRAAHWHKMYSDCALEKMDAAALTFKLAESEKCRETLRELVKHIDLITYRDGCALRLGAGTPQYDAAKAAVAC